MAPWSSDRLQVCAYTLLLEEHTSTSIEEARIGKSGDILTVTDTAGQKQVFPVRKEETWVFDVGYQSSARSPCREHKKIQQKQPLIRGRVILYQMP